FATLYGVQLTSLGPSRLFSSRSNPTGTGPFPSIYYSPKYQSVLEIIPQGTANLQRSRYITFSLAGRGQRNADTPFAAMFPGLLTEGIDNAASYAFRGIVADSARGLESLLTRRDLAGGRLVLVANDVALRAARALEPRVAALKGPVTVHESEQSTYKDGLYAERWMAARCGITDVQSILPEHWRD